MLKLSICYHEWRWSQKMFMYLLLKSIHIDHDIQFRIHSIEIHISPVICAKKKELMTERERQKMMDANHSLVYLRISINEILLDMGLQFSDSYIKTGNILQSFRNFFDSDLNVHGFFSHHHNHLFVIIKNIDLHKN